MRNRIVPSAFLVLACACGSGRTCTDVSGQDCGDEITVTLEYVSLRAADAGAMIGGTDAGNAGAQTACDYCAVKRTMPLTQYEFAVKPHVPCVERWQSATDLILDCAVQGCGSSSIPQGAAAGACVWAPPLLPP